MDLKLEYCQVQFDWNGEQNVAITPVVQIPGKMRSLTLGGTGEMETTRDNRGLDQ